MQQFVQFVGPRDDSGPADGSAGAGRARHRILQLLPEGKENPDGGKAVLVEAFNEDWYEEAQVPENVTTLFPEYGKYAHV